MQTTHWLIVVALAAALALQGCAANSGLTYKQGAAQSGSQAQASQEAAAPSAPVASLPAQGSDTVVKADTQANFEAVAAAVQKQMQPGGRWQYVNKNERATVDGSFADMAKLYDQFGSVDKMDQAAKVRLLADQSTVNAILTRKDGDRLICETTVPVGSHFPVKTCKTYAQIQSEQNGAQQYLRKHGATPQTWSGH